MILSNNPYACAFCQDSFSTASDLVKHVQNSHNSVQNSVIQSENDIKEDHIEKSSMIDSSVMTKHIIS